MSARGRQGGASLLAAGFWSALLQWARVGLNAIVFLILSRWLSLEQIGAFAAAQAPVVYLHALQRSIIPDAVVQQQDITDRQSDTLFWISMATGVVFSLGLVAVAEVLPVLTGSTAVRSLLLALSPTPLFLAVAAVSDGLMRKRLEMKQLTLRTVVATGLAAVPTLYLGYAGYGPWALTAFMGVSSALASLLTFFMARWRPALRFDRDYAGRMAPMLLSLLGRYGLTSLTLPLFQFAVITNLGLVAGGIFQLGQRLLGLVDSLVTTPVRFVALPMFARLSADDARFATGFTKGVGYAAVLTAPIYLGLAAVAPMLLPLVVGPENGPPAVTTFQLLCLYGPPGVVVGLISQAFVSRGRASVAFNRAVLMFVLSTTACVGASFFSVEAVALAYSLVAGFVGLLPSLALVQRYCGVSAGALLRAAGAPLLAAVVMAAVVLPATLWGAAHVRAGIETLAALAVCIVLGVVIYGLLMLVVARREAVTLFHKLAPDRRASHG